MIVLGNVAKPFTMDIIELNIELVELNSQLHASDPQVNLSIRLEVEAAHVSHMPKRAPVKSAKMSV